MVDSIEYKMHNPYAGQTKKPQAGGVATRNGKFRARVMIEGIVYFHPTEFETREEAQAFVDLTMEEGASL